VVLDQVDAAADAVAESLSDEVPVALIDPLALKGFQQLGAASPLVGARPWYDAAEEESGDGLTRMQRLAADKLNAAKVLMGQGMSESALDLALAAMLAAAADAAGKDTPVAAHEAGVWLFSGAIPSGLLDSQDASLIMKGIGLSQGSEVPDDLVAEPLDDADRFISG